MITGQDILILSTQDWDALPTRKHHWARRFASQGNRVLYVEQQMHWLGFLADMPGQLGRAGLWRRGPRQLDEHLWVFTLPIMPPFFQMVSQINRGNNWMLRWVLRWALKQLEFQDIILWIYTPHSGDLVGCFAEKLAVYECVDEFSATRGLVYGPTIAALERSVLAKVDLVIVTHPNLLKTKSKLAQRVALVPNGADFEHFALASEPETTVAPAVAELRRPVIGFHGWIQYWVDFELIAYAAKAHPEWSFVFVGPIEPLARVDKVRSMRNVHFLGKQPYADMPSYVAGFDVCVNPFVLGDLSDAVSPIKLYEYLASGKPVVSVDMPAAREFSDLITLARTPQEFLSGIEAILGDGNNGRSVESTVARQTEAAGNSWSTRFDEVQAVIKPYIASDGMSNEAAA